MFRQKEMAAEGACSREKVDDGGGRDGERRRTEDQEQRDGKKGGSGGGGASSTGRERKKKTAEPKERLQALALGENTPSRQQAVDVEAGRCGNQSSKEYKSRACTWATMHAPALNARMAPI